MPGALTILWVASITGNGIAALRLQQLKLHRVYRFFFAYLVFAAVRSLTLFMLPAGVSGKTYAVVYFITAPILWAFYVLVVVELYSLVLRDYPGIQSLSRWTLRGGVFFSILVSILALIPSAGNESSRLLIWCTTVERGIVFSLVILLLVVLLFVSLYPVHVRRNILVHYIIYTVFFLGISATILIRNVVGRDVMHILNTVVLAMNLGCYAAWTFFLTRKGEMQITMLRHNWTPAQERRLIEQLESANATLIRAARHL